MGGGLELRGHKKGSFSAGLKQRGFIKLAITLEGGKACSGIRGFK